MLYISQPFAMNLKRAVYALDSTVIDLSLSLFPWAQHRRHKSAVKVHTQLDLQCNIPAFIRITGGQTHDVHEKLLKESNAQNEFYLILINGDFIECRKKNNELIYLKDGKKVDGLRWNPNK